MSEVLCLMSCVLCLMCCVLCLVLRSATSSGENDPTYSTLYGLLCTFVTFVFQKNRSTGFCAAFRNIVGRGRPHVQYALRSFVYFCHFCVSKKYATGLLCCTRYRRARTAPRTVHSTVFCALLSLLCFKKTALRASVMCSATSSGENDPTYSTLYGLLCTFVTFVFQKNRSTGLLCCVPLHRRARTTPRTVRSTVFCVLLSLLCFKKTALRVFCAAFRDIVGRERPDVRCLCLMSCVGGKIIFFRKKLFYYHSIK